MYLFQWLYGWWMTFWFFETMPAQGLVAAAQRPRSLVVLWGAGREGGGSAVRGLAQSFSKSILALQALDNLENIIQNSPFQHVSSIKGVFSSRVSTMLVRPRNAQIRLKRKKNCTYSFSFSLSLSKHLWNPMYVCLCVLLWIFLFRTKNLNYGVSWYYFRFKALAGVGGCFPL